jgi:hypothetical protein
MSKGFLSTEELFVRVSLDAVDAYMEKLRTTPVNKQCMSNLVARTRDFYIKLLYEAFKICNNELILITSNHKTYIYDKITMFIFVNMPHDRRQVIPFDHNYIRDLIPFSQESSQQDSSHACNDELCKDCKKQSTINKLTEVIAEIDKLILKNQ